MPRGSLRTVRCPFPGRPVMRMSAFVMSFVLLASAGCFAGVQKGETKEYQGNAQTREVPAFHAVSVESGIHATISIGPQRPLQLQGDEKVLALVETTVEDGELRIGFKRHKWHWTTSDVHVVIQTPELQRIEASGGSPVEGGMGARDGGGGGQQWGGREERGARDGDRSERRRRGARPRRRDEVAAIERLGRG